MAELWKGRPSRRPDVGRRAQSGDSRFLRQCLTVVGRHAVVKYVAGTLRCAIRAEKRFRVPSAGRQHTACACYHVPATVWHEPAGQGTLNGRATRGNSRRKTGMASQTGGVQVASQPAALQRALCLVDLAGRRPRRVNVRLRLDRHRRRQAVLRAILRLWLRLATRLGHGQRPWWAA